MTYLLDTNVVSELRKSKTRKIDRNVYNWAKSIPANSMFLSVVSLLELELGVQLVERREVDRRFRNQIEDNDRHSCAANDRENRG